MISTKLNFTYIYFIIHHPCLRWTYGETIPMYDRSMGGLYLWMWFYIISELRIAPVTPISCDAPVSSETPYFRFPPTKSCSESIGCFNVDLLTSAYFRYQLVVMVIPLDCVHVSGLDTPAVMSTSSFLTGHLITSSWNSLNSLPCIGLAKMFSRVFYIGKWPI